MLRNLLPLALLHQASGACFKHVSCTSCIAESNDAGYCMWYTQPRLEGIGACVAGHPGYAPPQELSGQLATDAYGLWSMALSTGETAYFTVHDIDQISDDSCYTTECLYQAQCDPGYYAVENNPCYSDDVFPAWRELHCCRQQRNINGYLRGFEATHGIIDGKLFYASCCATCYPGEVIVGCHAYFAGVCQTCAAGRFNPTGSPGSSCEECQPCEAGKIRRGCGPATAGLCVECEAGSEFKTIGLEGAWTDTCQACESCPRGHVRVGCGGADPGYCSPCVGGSFFAAPFCRTCFTCIQGERRGCGGQQIGVCTDCRSGRYEVANTEGACLDCETCSEDEAEMSADGFQVSGPWVRVGCGAAATGKCVRMAAQLNLEGVTRCPTAADPEALCEGASVSARWTMHGLSLRQLDAEYGNCTAEASLCLSGFWRVALYRREIDNFAGAEVAELGDWFSAELEQESSLDAPNAVLMKRGLQLPSGLPEASGYFLRVFFFDAGGSCCAGTSVAPLFADSEDLSLAGHLLDVQAAVDVAAEDISSGSWQAAHTLLSDTCASHTGDIEGTWEACERSKALQLGLPAGQRSLLPFALLHSSGSADIAALGAAFPVKEAGERLLDMEQIHEVMVQLIPPNLTVWRSLVQPLFAAPERLLSNSTSNGTGPSSPNATEEPSGEANESQGNASSNASAASGSNASNSSNATAESGTTSTTSTTAGPVLLDFTEESAEALLEQLKREALQAAAGAEALRAQWQSEVSSCVQLLAPKLRELQEIDKLLGESAEAAGFSVVRMAQAATWKLRKELQDLVNATDLVEKEQKSIDVLQRIGSMALMMLGTWGQSWYHGLEWRLLVQVDSAAWPPNMMPPMGGGLSMPGAVPIADTRQRVWEPFLEVAESWFSFAEEIRLELENQTDFGTSALSRLLPIMHGAVDQVAAFTEEVLEPYAREGSMLFAGPLPNISQPASCGNRGWCLSFVARQVSEELALEDAWDGFGPQAVRPWIDPRVEDLRLKRASTEILQMAWGRIRIFEELLLQVIDVRDIQKEPSISAAASAQSTHIAAHIDVILQWSKWSNMSSSAGSDRPEAAWHWHELRKLRSALDLSRRSAALLARRRLSRLELLTAWVSGQRDDGYSTGPATWSWRQPWSPWSLHSAGSPAMALFDASAAAAAKLEAAIGEQELHAATRAQAYLRIDISSDLHPVAYAGLVQTGSAMLRLMAPAGRDHMMMHSDAKAFLISLPASQLPDPLQAGAETGEAPSGAFPQPHVELRLKRLSGAFDAADTSVEPPQEGTLPFVTRHDRGTCMPLAQIQAEKAPEIVPAALLPLDGFWVLTARDGTTARLLQIDEGTVLRLLFEIDVPDGTPPWPLLSDTRDVLYKLPEDGLCSGLRPIFGSAPETSTFPPTTRTTLHTQTATTIPLIPTTSRQGVIIVEEEEDLVLAPKRSTSLAPGAAPEPWTPPIWFYAVLFLLVLGAMVLAVRWTFKYQRRRIQNAGKIVPEALQEEGKVPVEEGTSQATQEAAPTILTKDGSALREAAAVKASENPYLAMAKKSPKKMASRKSGSWEISDTPREDDPKNEDEDNKSWSEASTPEGSDAEDGGSSSHSSLHSPSSSSGDSSSGRSRSVSPRTALAAKALGAHAQNFSPDALTAGALRAHAQDFLPDARAAQALEAHAKSLASSSTGPAPAPALPVVPPAEVRLQGSKHSKNSKSSGDSAVRDAAARPEEEKEGAEARGVDAEVQG
ncbi:unnamed protein product [Symbiodinium microadriaticum]|nr:unnamed protein product [Symbiodinium microadriaticum]